MSVPELKVFCLSREGRRDSNEDAAEAAVIRGDGTPVSAYVVVCDGMGGHNAGEVASAMAVGFFRKSLERFATHGQLSLPEGLVSFLAYLNELVGQVNKDIYDAGTSTAAQKGMGTTLALALVAGERQLVVVNVGDSKIFLVRGVEVRQLSVDHTALAEQRRALNRDGGAPEDDAAHPFAHALTRSLGQEPVVEPDISAVVDLEPGDLVVVTTDGVTDVLESERFLSAVETSATLEEVAETIFEKAFRAGSKDNITVGLLAFGLPQRLGEARRLPGTESLEDTMPVSRKGRQIVVEPSRAGSTPFEGSPGTRPVIQPPGADRRRGSGPGRRAVYAVAGAVILAGALSTLLVFNQNPADSGSPVASSVPIPRLPTRSAGIGTLPGPTEGPAGRATPSAPAPAVVVAQLVPLRPTIVAEPVATVRALPAPTAVEEARGAPVSPPVVGPPIVSTAPPPATSTPTPDPTPIVVTVPPGRVEPTAAAPAQTLRDATSLEGLRVTGISLQRRTNSDLKVNVALDARLKRGGKVFLRIRSWVPARELKVRDFQEHPPWTSLGGDARGVLTFNLNNGGDDHGFLGGEEVQITAELESLEPKTRIGFSLMTVRK